MADLLAPASVAGATGARYRLGNKVKPMAVEELSGDGPIENMEMSKSAGGSDGDTMNSASVLAENADCPLETAQCWFSVSSSLHFSECSFSSSFLYTETVDDAGYTLSCPRRPEGFPRRCGGSPLRPAPHCHGSDFGTRVVPVLTSHG